MNRASKAKKLEIIQVVGDMPGSSWWCDGEWVKVAGGAVIQITPRRPRLRLGQLGIRREDL